MVEDKHVIEALGKTKIVIKNGEITSIGEPNIESCPIFNKYHHIEKLTEEEIIKNINYRIKDFGMCTKDRVLKMGDMLSVGISEILRSNVELGNIDCVVGVCEGVGTLLITDPDIVQGVGGRVSGLVSTTPIPEVINQLNENDILNPQTAEINQVEGLKKAIDNGYKKIAITMVPSVDVIKELRKIESESDVSVYIFVAHTTKTNKEDVKILFDNADIVTACASKHIIEYAQVVKPYYYGSSVPIYAVTESGHKLLDTRLEHVGKSKSINDYPQDLSKMAQKLL